MRHLETLRRVVCYVILMGENRGCGAVVDIAVGIKIRK